MIGALLKMSGFLILRLIYGKNQKKIKEIGAGLPILLSIGFIFWLLCLLFLIAGITANDFMLCLIIGIGYPVALIVLGIVVRTKKSSGSTEGMD